MSFLRRDAGEVDSLVTDRYLDSLLAISAPDEPGRFVDPADPGRGASVGAAVRAVSRRLATDLPRFHPSFRFEERLALRLAELAASIRLPVAAGGEGQVVSIRAIEPAGFDPRHTADPGEDEDRDTRPLLIGGAVAASALSIAGAWLAWRRRTSPIARAIRAAHHIRPGA